MNYWHWIKQKMGRKNAIAQIIGIVFLGFLWEIVAYNIALYDIFPNITQLLRKTLSLVTQPDFHSTLASTLIRGGFGFAISLFIAFSAALWATQNSFVKYFFQPIIVVFRSIPVIAIVLIAMLWFNNNFLPVFIAFFSMFPIMYQNILSGLEHTDKKLVEMAKVFGKTKPEILRSIYLPSAKKLIVDGLKTALGFGWRAVIIGEVLAQPMRGIGTKMKEAQAFINISELIAWTVIAIIISFIFDKILVYALNFKTKPKYNLRSNEIPLQETKNKVSIVFENIHKKFDEKIIFEAFNLAIENDKKHLLKWPSGTGKTTLLRMVAGLEKTDKGSIIFNIINLKIAYSFQDLRLLPWKNTIENIMYGCNNELHRGQKFAIASRIIAKLDLQVESQLLPQQMSGGQQQRVALGRALAAQSDILLLDEPLNGLDDATKNKTLEFILEWTASYKPLILWSTHENINASNMEGASEILLHNYSQSTQ